MSPLTPSPPTRKKITLAAFAAATVAIAGLMISPSVAALPSAAPAAARADASTSVGIISDSAKPKITAHFDRSAVELGIRFTPTVSGKVTALQYYQTGRASGVQKATLWASNGKTLARQTFKPSKKVGWHTVALRTPVSLTKGKTYVASYHAPKGGYGAVYSAFTKSKKPTGFIVKPGAGVYRYGKKSTMPTSTYRNSNYFVDVVYQPAGTTAKPTTKPVTEPTEEATTKPTIEPTTQPTAKPTTSPTKPATKPATDTATKPAPKPTTPSAPTTSTGPTTPPTAAGCIGAPNTPGGADPWGGCWPGPQNTGYPQGLAGDTRTPVKLTAYTGPTTIRSCGVVIDSKIVNDTLVIQAGNGTKSKSTPCVTIRNSLVKGVIYSELPSYGPVLIEDTEVHPSGLPFWENIGRSNFYAYRVNSHGGEGVIKCDSHCEAKDNWVHGMRLGGSYHYNAFGGNGTNNFRIEHNYASCGDWESVADNVTSDAGCSAVIGFYGDFAPIQNITIHRNYLASTFPSQKVQAGYCLNPGYYPGKAYPAPKNMTVTENVFARGSTGKCGLFGPTNSLNQRGAPNGNVWEANRYSDGTPIARNEE
ncbi:MAG: DUF4082 domain-containing protein [Microbacterium sp.]